MSRRNKRRAREAEAAEQHQIHSNTIEEFKESYNYGNTTRVSGKSSLDSPGFLTDSERNIIKRAATADGQPEVSLLLPAFARFIATFTRLTFDLADEHLSAWSATQRCN